MPPAASTQSNSKMAPKARTTSGTRTRRPSSWMCSSERQSKFWLPKYASRPSTMKYLACCTPPMDFAVSMRRTSAPRAASRSSVSSISGYCFTNFSSTSSRTRTPRAAAASMAWMTGSSRLPGRCSRRTARSPGCAWPRRSSPATRATHRGCPRGPASSPPGCSPRAPTRARRRRGRTGRERVRRGGGAREREARAEQEEAQGHAAMFSHAPASRRALLLKRREAPTRCAGAPRTQRLSPGSPSGSAQHVQRAAVVGLAARTGRCSRR